MLRPKRFKSSKNLILGKKRYSQGSAKDGKAAGRREMVP
jgi:hypothetical protein